MGSLSLRSRLLPCVLAVSVGTGSCATVTEAIDQQPPEVQIGVMAAASGVVVLAVAGILGWNFLDTSSAGDSDEPEKKVMPILREEGCAAAVEETNRIGLPTMKGFTEKTKTTFGGLVERVHESCVESAERLAKGDASRDDLVKAVAILQAAGELETGDLVLEDRRSASGFSSARVSVSAKTRDELKDAMADRIVAIDAEEERKRKEAEELARQKREAAEKTLAFAKAAEEQGHFAAALGAYASVETVDDVQKALREERLAAMAQRVNEARVVPVAISNESTVPDKLANAVTQRLKAKGGAFRLVSQKDGAALMLAVLSSEELSIKRSEERVQLSHSYQSGTQEVPNPRYADKERAIADTLKEIESRQKTIARTKCDSRDCTAADRDKLKRSQERLRQYQKELSGIPRTKTVPATAEHAYEALSKDTKGALPIKLVIRFTDGRPPRDFQAVARFESNSYTHGAEPRVGLKAKSEQPPSDDAVTQQVYAAGATLFADTIAHAPVLYAETLQAKVDAAKTPAEKLHWAMLRWSMTGAKTDEERATLIAKECFPGRLSTFSAARAITGQ